MPVAIYTARVSYGGRDRLDITRKSGGPNGLPFAPSWSILRPMLDARKRGVTTLEGDQLWSDYVRAYTAEMRKSYRAHRTAWDAVLAREVVTLVCYCADSSHCHRRVLSWLLGKCGGLERGERLSADR
jgi:hypothetical protein